jgi:hypothetical protein
MSYCEVRSLILRKYTFKWSIYVPELTTSVSLGAAEESRDNERRFKAE